MWNTVLHLRIIAVAEVKILYKQHCAEFVFEIRPFYGVRRVGLHIFFVGYYKKDELIGVLYVDDFEANVAFYEDKLGLPRVHQWDHGPGRRGVKVAVAVPVPPYNSGSRGQDPLQTALCGIRL